MRNKPRFDLSHALIVSETEMSWRCILNWNLINGDGVGKKKYDKTMLIACLMDASPAIDLSKEKLLINRN